MQPNCILSNVLINRALSARPTGDELSSVVSLVAVKNILDSSGAEICVAATHPGAQVTVHFPLVQAIT